MKRFLIGAAALGLVVAMSTVYPEAQGRGGGDGFTNLQVLPSDIDPQQLIGLMQGAAQALGVNCAYCHVFNGRGAPDNDFASDEKAPKNVARGMIRMVQQINMGLAENIDKPADELTSVGCMTCHRGSAIPMIEEAPAAD